MEQNKRTHHEKEILAPYSRRVGAWVIDFLVVGTALIVMGAPLYLFLDERLADGLSRLIGLISFIGYRSIFDTYYGGTLGRWAMGFKLLKETGEPPALSTNILRNFVLFFPLPPINTTFLLLGCISWRRRTLLDRVFGTYIVAMDNEPSEGLPLWMYRRRRLLIVLGVLLFILSMISTILLSLPQQTADITVQTI